MSSGSQLLKEHDVRFEPASVTDPAGRVFYHEGRVFRALGAEGSLLARDILGSDDLEALLAAGLVRTEASSVRLEGYDLVLEHERVPFVSYASEWVGAMLRDAALTFCDLCIALARMGYASKDAHPWNILFHGCQPVFVDFGSICRLSQSYRFPAAEFRRHFVLPLWLLSRGYEKIAYQVLREHPTGSAKMAFETSKAKWLPFWFHRLARRYQRACSTEPQQALLAFLGELRDRLAGLSLDTSQGQWSDYPQDIGVLGDPSTYKVKAASAHKVLERNERGTLLDMACSRGWFSHMAKGLGYEVVGFDYEASAVTEVYERGKQGGENILPLRMNFLWPTPSFGMALSGPSAFQRLQCDTTLVLALVHHLVFGQKVGFETIASIINAYTRHRSIVEFIPAEDRFVSEWMTDAHGWYSQEGFIAAMQPYFPNVEILPSNPEPRSILAFSR